MRESLKKIDDYDDRLDLYKIILINMYMSNSDDDEFNFKYDDIERIINDINIIGINEIVDSFDELFKNYQPNSITIGKPLKLLIDNSDNGYINIEIIDKYLYLKEKCDLSKLNFSFYKESNENFNDFKYMINSDLYDLAINEFIDKNRIDEEKLDKIYSNKKNKREANKIYELMFEKNGYIINEDVFLNLSFLHNRNPQLPNLTWITKNSIDNNDINKSIDNIKSEYGFDGMLNVIFNLKYDNKLESIKYLKEKYSDELLNFEKELINNSDKELLDIFHKNMLQDINISKPKKKRTIY